MFARSKPQVNKTLLSDFFHGGYVLKHKQKHEQLCTALWEGGAFPDFVLIGNFFLYALAFCFAFVEQMAKQGKHWIT